MEDNAARGQRRQAEPRADVDRAGRRGAAAQGGHGQTGRHGGADGAHAAADKDFPPWDAGLLQRGDGHFAHAAWCGLRRQAQRLARVMREIGRGHPAEGFVEDGFAVAAAGVVAQGDGGVEFVPIEGIERLARTGNADLQQRGGFGADHLPQQPWQFRAHDVVADADRQPARLGAERAERALVRGDELPRGGQEGVSVLRQADDPGRAFQQPAAQPVFQPLDLQAHGRLRGVHRLGRPREAFQVGGEYEGLYRFDVQHGHG